MMIMKKTRTSFNTTVANDTAKARVVIWVMYIIIGGLSIYLASISCRSPSRVTSQRRVANHVGCFAVGIAGG